MSESTTLRLGIAACVLGVLSPVLTIFVTYSCTDMQGFVPLLVFCGALAPTALGLAIAALRRPAGPHGLAVAATLISGMGTLLVAGTLALLIFLATRPGRFF